MARRTISIPWDCPTCGGNGCRRCGTGKVLVEVLKLPIPASPFRDAAEELLRESGCTVLKWRKSYSGVAYCNDKRWGIETPEPRGPKSFVVLAHEVGHQMLHRHRRHRDRWLEEIEAWEYALAQFDRFDLPNKASALDSATIDLRVTIDRIAKRRHRAQTRAAIMARLPDWVGYSEERWAA